MAESHRRPSAVEAYPDFFVQADAVIDKFHQWIDRDDIPDDRTWWGIVRLAILIRAFNQYRSIVNLLRNNHWEDALILVRSLFELLLNTEELCRRAEDIEVAAESFAAFAHLQRYLRWREHQVYTITTGRTGADARATHRESGRSREEVFRVVLGDREEGARQVAGGLESEDRRRSVPTQRESAP